MSYGVSSRLLDEQPAEMSMEPNNASNTIAIMTDRNQIGIDLKSTAKTIRMRAMVEALTTQRMRMRMMRLVNNNLTTFVSRLQKPFAFSHLRCLCPFQWANQVLRLAQLVDQCKESQEPVRYIEKL
jgi:hypothetical protein